VITFDSISRSVEGQHSQYNPISELGIWPSLLPEESLWGYRERLFMLNSARPLYGLRQLSCSRICRYAAPLFPKGMNTMLQFLPGPSLEVKQVARATTVLPLMDWILNKEQINSLVDALRSGRAAAPRIQEMGHGKTFPRHCPACAEEDEAAFGVPYWRRLHQVGTVTVCPEHNLPLLAGCGSCNMRDLGSASWKLPSSICACGRPQRSVISDEDSVHLSFLSRLSRLVGAMLVTNCPDSFAEKCGHATAHAFVARGYVARGAPSAARLQAELADAGELAVLRKLGMRECLPHTFLRMTKGLGSTSLAVRLAVIDRLFGTFDEYLSACEAAAPFDPPSRKRQPFSIQQLEESRCKVMNYITINPHSTRVLVRKAIGKSFDFVLHYDPHWVDEKIPKVPRMRNPISLGRSRRIAALDAEIAAHITARAAAVLALTSKPRRLCDATLLAGYRYAVRANLGPLAMEVLDECIESIEDFRLRSINWAIENHAAFRVEEHRKKFIQMRLAEGTNAYSLASRLIAAGRPVTHSEVTIRPSVGKAAERGATHGLPTDQE
jgi:hypothetical protein